MIQIVLKIIYRVFSLSYLINRLFLCATEFLILHDRSQFVEFKFVKSAPFHTSSGVTQGSNIGPILCSVYIDHLKQYLACHFLLYSDTLTIFDVINSEADCIVLQQFVDSVVKWCNFNILKVNSSKCCVLTHSRRARNLNYEYMIDNITSFL